MTAGTTSAPPPPYLELFGCRLATEDDHDHPGDCDYGFNCNHCGWDVTAGGPCPHHAPAEIPGLVRAECSEGHPVTFFYASEGYPPPCMYCAWDAEAKAHSGCRHSHHGPWRSWKAVHRVDHWLAMTGVGGFTSITWGGGCRGCVSRWRWGGGSHILWRRKAVWGCLLLRHHRRSEIGCDGYYMGDLCAICAPCPGCDYCTGGRS